MRRNKRKTTKKGVLEPPLGHRTKDVLRAKEVRSSTAVLSKKEMAWGELAKEEESNQGPLAPSQLTLRRSAELENNGNLRRRQARPTASKAVSRAEEGGKTRARLVFWQKKIRKKNSSLKKKKGKTGERREAAGLALPPRS